MIDFGKKVRERREALGMTQEELAVKLGYRTQSSIAKIESGVNDPVLSKVKDFSRELQVPISYFLDWDKKEPIPFTVSGAKALELIEKYSRLTSANQEAVSTLIDKLLEAQS